MKQGYATIAAASLAALVMGIGRGADGASRRRWDDVERFVDAERDRYHTGRLVAHDQPEHQRQPEHEHRHGQSELVE